jgi:hypothetical protein
MENNLTEPNYDKMLFRIEIVVYENGQTLQVFNTGDYKANYQETIGALEIMQRNWIWDQSGINAAKYREWKLQQDKLEKENNGE